MRPVAQVVRASRPFQLVIAAGAVGLALGGTALAVAASDERPTLRILSGSDDATAPAQADGGERRSPEDVVAGLALRNVRQRLRLVAGAARESVASEAPAVSPAAPAPAASTAPAQPARRTFDRDETTYEPADEYTVTAPKPVYLGDDGDGSTPTTEPDTEPTPDTTEPDPEPEEPEDELEEETGEQEEDASGEAPGDVDDPDGGPGQGGPKPKKG